MRQIRMAFDIDGVLANFTKSFADLIHAQTGLRMPPESDTYPNEWNWHLTAGVTKEQDNDLWRHIAKTDFWGTLPPIQSNVDLLRQLMMDGPSNIDYYFVTTRPGDRAKSLTEAWLVKHLRIPFPTVLVSANKGAIAAGLNLDAIIDDKPENLFDVHAQSPKTVRYLLKQP